MSQIPPPAPPAPPAPPTPSVTPAPPSGIIPPPPSAPAGGAPPVAPIPTAGAAPTIPLRPAGLTPSMNMEAGMKTVPIPQAQVAPIRPTPSAGIFPAQLTPTVPLGGGAQPTAQLPKATIALTPTGPLSAAAPVSSASLTARKFAQDDDSSSIGYTIAASVAAIVALVFLVVQIQIDRLPDKNANGVTEDIMVIDRAGSEARPLSDFTKINSPPNPDKIAPVDAEVE